MLRGTWEVGRTVSAGRHSLTHSLGYLEPYLLSPLILHPPRDQCMLVFLAAAALCRLLEGGHHRLHHGSDWLPGFCACLC